MIEKIDAVAADIDMTLTAQGGIYQRGFPHPPGQRRSDRSGDRPGTE